jgi:pimeloyl-ACP methyl ester carboxylesterase
MEFTEHYLTSFDGTEIAYQTCGQGPSIVLANGLGGALIAWKHVIEEFRDRFRFVSWDYRGIFHSRPPADTTALTVPDHARDMKVVLDHLGITEAVVMGWSMGVQVALEFTHLYPEQVRALILVNGSYGDIFEAAFENPLSRHILPNVTFLARKFHRLIKFGLELGTANQRALDATIFLAKKAGLVDRHMDTSVFYELAREFATNDQYVYWTIMEYLSRHSAEEYLCAINAPTLVIHGENDLFTPLRVTDTYMREIPNCELFKVPGGSHYSIVEFPEIVNLRLERFLRPFLGQ